MQTKEHWQHVYSTKASDTVSWFQAHAETSLRLIGSTGAAASATMIDVGGGASTLVDDLIEANYVNLTVLDLSAAALATSRKRLGPRAERVRWLETDILLADLPAQAFDIWHDRAVFHFLTMPQERQAYVEAARRAVRPGGHLIIATFAEDGPTRCSGLPVMRYSAEALQLEFGDRFQLLHHETQEHRTPSGGEQSFVYCQFRVLAEKPQPSAQH